MTGMRANLVVHECRARWKLRSTRARCDPSSAASKTAVQVEWVERSTPMSGVAFAAVNHVTAGRCEWRTRLRSR